MNQMTRKKISSFYNEYHILQSSWYSRKKALLLVWYNWLKAIKL